MRLLIVTGGTGGHIYPALALADAAKKRYSNCEILFVGNDDRMEATLIPEENYPFQALHTSGFTGSIMQKAKAILQMGIAYRKAKKIISNFQPDVAIGFGGYVSAPVMLAAKANKVCCMIHEQNSIAGAANRLLYPKMDGVIVCYERVMQEFACNYVRLLGNPRASSAAQINFDANYFASFHLDEKRPIILIVMGSLGSSSINKIMCEALTKVDPNYQIIFVSGKQNYENVKQNFQEKENIRVVDYINQLAIIDKVDLIICRAGATTAAEITAKGVASIIIPSPYVANNHQYYNASVLKDRGCAEIIEEKHLTAQTLTTTIDKIMKNPMKLESMKQKAKTLGYINASSDILDWMDELRRGNIK